MEPLARPDQTLTDHLNAVARRAGEFGEKIRSPVGCRCVAWLHDSGKAAPAWQAYLAGRAERVSHAPESAALALRLFGDLGFPLAYAIKAHHTHLPDFHGDLDHWRSWLRDDLLAEIERRPPLPEPVERLITRLKHEIQIYGTSHELLQLWIRMLASVLIDADRLDAEAVENPEAARRRGLYDAWETLEKRFEERLDTLGRLPPTPVNAIRNAVLAEVLAKADARNGFFTLNVPTGGGKTLAAMAFALKHRRANQMSRVVMAIPYNSIIEQTAAVYKGIFGDENVLEHHSNFDPGDSPRYRAAVENWDAPLIVTTNVQLFESLLKSGASEIRKLHNLAGSVIILDEAQMLPRDHLQPILATLRALVAGFGCTVVLCSATIPALTGRIRRSNGSGFEGLPVATDLVGDAVGLSRKLRRTRIRHLGRLDPGELADRLAAAGQALCIVNTKRLCRRLFELVDAPRKVHLSAAMCPAERKIILADVRAALAADEDVVIVATQLIEAGVDIDVRTVFRELAGVDSIAQAAGRCNREGKRECGEVFTFDTGERPPYTLLAGCNAARNLLPDDGEWEMTPELYRRYFEQYYYHATTFDRAAFASCFGTPLQYQFDAFAKEFNMIDNSYQSPLVVLYGDAAKWIAELREAGGPDRRLLRKLQPYTVNVAKTLLDDWRASGCIETIAGIDVQAAAGLYQPGTGIRLPDGNELWNF